MYDLIYLMYYYLTRLPITISGDESTDRSVPRKDCDVDAVPDRTWE